MNLYDEHGKLYKLVVDNLKDIKERLYDLEQKKEKNVRTDETSGGNS